MVERLELLAKSPAAGLLPVEAGEMRLTEQQPDAITWVAPLKGQDAAVSAALRERLGTDVPSVGRARRSDTAQVLWCGLGQFLVLGSPVTPAGAAHADQSNGYAVLLLEGPMWADVLARLTPLDLRPRAFGEDTCAVSLLGHVTCLFHRKGAEQVQMLVPSAMVGTAVQEIAEAMGNVS